LILIGGLTIFIAGVGANFEFDLKKIIALSTLRQLGLIIIVLAIGFPGLAFFHLLTHAIFKALLFLCAGGIIHRIKNSQDIRDIGSLFIFLPFTTSCLNVANMALCGIPFLAGFYSKDLILEVSLLSYLNVISLFLYFFSTGLTVCYTLRLTYYSLLINFNVSSLNPINDEGSFMSKGIIGLLFIAVVRGAGLSWLYFSTFMVVCLPIYFKNLTLTVCLMGGLGGYSLRVTNFNTLNKSLDLFYKYTFFFSFIWFMPQFSTIGVSFYPLKLGFEIVKILDQG
jgi:NADH-ubiquinone oxidoreductase chain 5